MTTIRPSNDRTWLADVARTPHGELSGDRLTIHDLRNFDYRSETDFAQQIGATAPWDYRILLNGYVDEMLYERGVIDTSRPFPEVRAGSLIDARAQAADQDPAFSRRIREGITVPRRFDETDAGAVRR